jgi:hypothetical protein
MMGVIEFHYFCLKISVENGNSQAEELEDNVGPSNMARQTVQMQFKPTAANPLSDNIVSYHVFPKKLTKKSDL